MNLESGFFNTNHDLGHVKAGKEYLVKFPYKGLKTIDETEASCDCVSVDVEKENSRLVVKWIPKDVPIHLKKEGHKQYSTQKSITVKYTKQNRPEIQEVIVLLFNAIVME